MPSLIGNQPWQVPSNGDLGKLAFMDVVDTVSHNPYYDTAISDVQPTLNLDFVNSKTLDPRITFARSTTATYYDGKSTAKAEENLLTYSQEFDNASWTKQNTTVTANATTAPDGTTTAESFITAGGVSDSLRSPNPLTIVSGITYTYSVYLKYNDKQWVRFRSYSATGSDKNAWVDVQNGTLGTVNSGLTASIVSVGNGWYRFIVTLVSASTSGGFNFYHEPSDNTVSGSAGTSYIWGAQLEQRSAVSAYTPTTTAPITNYIPTLQTAAANVARLDYDPITRVPNGLLIEESRSNLVTYSDDFSNAAWTKSASSVISNTIVAPDGTLTGDKLIANATNAFHGLDNSTNPSFTSGTTYTISAYAKSGGYGFLRLGFPSSAFGSVSALFDLTLGILGTRTGGVSSSIQDIGNGWYRCSLTATATTTASNGSSLIYIASAGSSVFTGDGFSGIYIWGAQLEAGAFPTSYIPTVASQVTRSADAASMTGTNFSSWYNQSEGTLYAESLAVTWGKPVAFISEGVGNNYIRIQSSDTNAFVFNVMTNAATVVQMNTGVSLAGKSALAFKANDFAGSANANTVTTDTLGALPIVTQLSIGSSIIGSANYLNGTIKKLTYYPVRLPNNEIQELTA